MRRDVFQAMADPTRRAIILLLAAQAMTPNAIAEHFASTRQAISKHLQVLTECQIVKTEAQGREIRYHLEKNATKEIEQFLAQYKKLTAKRFTQLDDVLSQLKERKT
jgi:DNA-binding transcriptional ArsR family regulator